MYKKTTARSVLESSCQSTGRTNATLQELPAKCCATLVSSMVTTGSVTATTATIKLGPKNLTPVQSSSRSLSPHLKNGQAADRWGRAGHRFTGATTGGGGKVSRITNIFFITTHWGRYVILRPMNTLSTSVIFALFYCERHAEQQRHRSIF